MPEQEKQPQRQVGQFSLEQIGQQQGLYETAYIELAIKINDHKGP